MGLDRRERPRGWGERGTGCSPLSTVVPPPRAPSATGGWGDTSPSAGVRVLGDGPRLPSPQPIHFPQP